MNDTRDGTSGSEGAGAEDVFVELLGQIIDRLDRQEEKLDALIETVAELREEQERQAEAVEENTAGIGRLADAQFETADATRHLVEVASVDRLHAGVTVMLLQKLFPDRVTDEAIVDAASKRLVNLRDGRHFDLLLHFRESLERHRQEQRERKAKKEAEEIARKQAAAFGPEGVAWLEEQVRLQRKQDERERFGLAARYHEQARQRERDTDRER